MKEDLEEPVTASDHWRGRSDAPVVLVEYGDFQCPYCGQAYAGVRELEATFGADLAVVFREFPLIESHEHALIAAAAAEAAGMQDRFWDMHDRLFEHQQQLSESEVVAHAKALGLDLGKFNHDLHSDGVAKRIERDLVSGEASGVPGTPTFFINGMIHEGPIDPEGLAAGIRKALAAKS